MELTATILIVLALVALVLALGAFWMSRRPERRSEGEPEPLPDSRPGGVQVTCDGITYDVTDTLFNTGVPENGCTVWAFRGPGHVRFRADDEGKVDVYVEVECLPPRTSLTVPITGPGNDLRFMNAEELKHTFPHAAT